MTASYSHAGDSLSALLPLLHAFNHRHRNQHRASHWWSSFGILRRALQALADDIAQPKQRPRQSPGNANARRRDDVDVVVARALWLRNHVVPRAYVAFTQLAADNQHAPLGLMLLAVLGRTDAILADLAPSEPPPTHQPSPAEQPLEPAKSHAPSAAESCPDRGVAISRQDVRPNGEGSPAPVPSSRKRPPEQALQHDQSKKTSGGGGDAKAKDKQKKKKKKTEGQDALSSLFGSLA